MQLRGTLQRADPAVLPLVRAERAAAVEHRAAADAEWAAREVAAAAAEAAREARRAQAAEDAAAERETLRDNVDALEVRVAVGSGGKV